MLICSAEYAQDIPIGHHYKKDANGKITYEAHYNDKGILKEPIREYDENGRLYKCYELVEGNYQGRNLPSGIPTGKFIDEYTFKAGSFEGEQTEFYPSAQMKMRVSFKKDNLLAFMKNGSKTDSWPCKSL